MFGYERADEFNGEYTFPKCLLKCKLKSILDLCNCIPYFMPDSYEDLIKNTTARCTLAHVPCLNKYRSKSWLNFLKISLKFLFIKILVKWRTLQPSTPNIKGLEQEYQDSLSCPHCYSLCTYTMYTLETTFNPISKNPPGGLLSQYNSTQGLIILRVFYADATGLSYRTSVVLTWYELLSNFGGLIALILGCSLMAIFELLYFGCNRWYQYLNRKFNDEKDDLKISLHKEMYSKKPPPINYSAVEKTMVNEYQRRRIRPSVFE